MWSQEGREYKEMFNRHVNASFNNDYICMFSCELPKWNKMRRYSYTRTSLENQTLKKPIQKIWEATNTNGGNSGMPHHWEQNWDASILKLLEVYETQPLQAAMTPIHLGSPL